MMFTLPKPSDGFDWVQAAAGPALVCRPLEPLARHLFTTRGWSLGSASKPLDPDDAMWHRVAAALDVDRDHLKRIHQVHGAAVVVHRAEGGAQAPGTRSRPDGDIIITNDSSLAVAIQTADCVPLLIADRRTGAVAAAHAGWRGLAARVPEVVIAAMDHEFGSEPSNLFVAIGPAIGACCYEVGDDVWRRFVDAGFEPSRIEKWFSDDPRASARNRSIAGLPARPRRDRWYFDLSAVTRELVENAGVPPTQIFVSELCTASHPDHLCSYRRDGAAAGRMAAAIRGVGQQTSETVENYRRGLGGR